MKKIDPKFTAAAGGYIRVSTPSQAKEGESLTTERKAIEHYAREREWKLLTVYADKRKDGDVGSNTTSSHLTEMTGLSRGTGEGRFVSCSHSPMI
jgi:hypothetical protein